MSKGLSWLLIVAAFLCAAGYSLKHAQTDSHLASAQQPADTTPYAKQEEAHHGSPLADLMKDKKSDDPPIKEKVARVASTSILVPSDHVGDSPVGTSSAIVHKALSVANIIDLPFQVPAHAATPRLHGTFHSYVQVGGMRSSEDDANIDLLVLNEQQHADLLSGRAGEAVFSAEDAHDQEVNFNMPPTFNQPTKYFLVFRNNTAKADKKIVQADFRVDF